MLTFLLICTLLFSASNFVNGFAPIIVKQPLESEIFFKVTNERQRQQDFVLVCEAEATPKPKYDDIQYFRVFLIDFPLI